MFVTDRLVYLQLQKTGCTAAAAVLADTVGGEQQGKHNRLDARPPDKLVVGSVRDPWSWYVSLWAFGCQGDGGLRRRLTRRLSTRELPARLRDAAREGGGTVVATLGDYVDGRRRPVRRWARLYGDSADAARFREWLRLLLDPSRAGDVSRAFAGSSLHDLVGYYSFRYLWLYSGDLDAVLDPRSFTSVGDVIAFDGRSNVLDACIRNEQMGPDLVDVLRRAGHDVDAGTERRVLDLARPRANTSAHAPVADYYDAETAELVARRDQLVAAKHGYLPPR